jgi:UDP-2,3-diacylglucosamine pyrophosphatase LpxH
VRRPWTRWKRTLAELKEQQQNRSANRVALKMSDKSHGSHRVRETEGLSAAFQAFAHRKFLEGFEVVILGHSHFPERIEKMIEGRKRLYINVGDWVTHRSYLRFTPPDQFELKRFSEG